MGPRAPGGAAAAVFRWDLGLAGCRPVVTDGPCAPCLQVNHGLTLSDLPLHTLNNILYRLSDGWDIVTLGQVTPALSALSEDGRLWRKLCQYHFAEKQVSAAAGAARSAGAARPPVEMERERCRFPSLACSLSCSSLGRTVTLGHPHGTGQDQVISLSWGSVASSSCGLGTGRQHAAPTPSPWPCQWTCHLGSEPMLPSDRHVGAARTGRRQCILRDAFG